jgi:hypothetical protein
MDGTLVETRIEERRPQCLLMSSTNVQELMRKTRRNMGRIDDFYLSTLRHRLHSRPGFTYERN